MAFKTETFFFLYILMSSNNFRLSVFRLAHSLASAVACNKGAPDSHLDCCLPPEEGMWW